LIPLLGEKLMKGPLGKAIDVFATLATVIGVAAALCFGSAQITSGLNFLFDVSKSFLVQLFVFIVSSFLFFIFTLFCVVSSIHYFISEYIYIHYIIMECRCYRY